MTVKTTSVDSSTTQSPQTPQYISLAALQTGPAQPSPSAKPSPNITKTGQYVGALGPKHQALQGELIWRRSASGQLEWGLQGTTTNYWMPADTVRNSTEAKAYARQKIQGGGWGQLRPLESNAFTGQSTLDGASFKALHTYRIPGGTGGQARVFQVGSATRPGSQADVLALHLGLDRKGQPRLVALPPGLNPSDYAALTRFMRSQHLQPSASPPQQPTTAAYQEMLGRDGGVYRIPLARATPADAQALYRALGQAGMNTDPKHVLKAGDSPQFRRAYEQLAFAKGVNDTIAGINTVVGAAGGFTGFPPRGQTSAKPGRGAAAPQSAQPTNWVPLTKGPGTPSTPVVEAPSNHQLVQPPAGNAVTPHKTAGGNNPEAQRFADAQQFSEKRGYKFGNGSGKITPRDALPDIGVRSIANGLPGGGDAQVSPNAGDTARSAIAGTVNNCLSSNTPHSEFMRQRRNLAMAPKHLPGDDLLSEPSYIPRLRIYDPSLLVKAEHGPSRSVEPHGQTWSLYTSPQMRDITQRFPGVHHAIKSLVNQIKYKE
ncbi:MAG: hypothetical protein RL341_1471, partial [Pseudomonadota bacterium]